MPLIVPPQDGYIPVPQRPQPGRPCPSCRAELRTWAGAGHPLPLHYTPAPGVGMACTGQAPPPPDVCGLCAGGCHSLCTGQVTPALPCQCQAPRSPTCQPTLLHHGTRATGA